MEDILSIRSERYQALLLQALRLYDAEYSCPVCRSRDPHASDCPVSRLLTSAEVDIDDMDDT